MRGSTAWSWGNAQTITKQLKLSGDHERATCRHYISRDLQNIRDLLVHNRTRNPTGFAFCLKKSPRESCVPHSSPDIVRSYVFKVRTETFRKSWARPLRHYNSRSTCTCSNEKSNWRCVMLKDNRHCILQKDIWRCFWRKTTFAGIVCTTQRSHRSAIMSILRYTGCALFISELQIGLANQLTAHAGDVLAYLPHCLLLDILRSWLCSCYWACGFVEQCSEYLPFDADSDGSETCLLKASVRTRCAVIL